MLEKPDIPEEAVLSGLREEYGLPVKDIRFLPLGADVNTAVYQVVAQDGTPYFLKLRQGNFDETAVAVPLFLRQQGIREIIAPLETGTGKGWGSLGSYKMILYPFIEGENAFQTDLSDRQLIELGGALRHIHAIEVPTELGKLLPREAFSPQWRQMVRGFQAQVEQVALDEPVAVKLAAFMRAKRDEIGRVVERAEELARMVQMKPQERVLCHADMHSGNLLITAGEELYIVDWDNPILAPRERDLMFINGGIGGALDSERAEELFFQGYGQVNVDKSLLAYYRYERIVQDFAAYVEELLLTAEGGEDREQGLEYFKSNFLPGGTIEMADKTETSH